MAERAAEETRHQDGERGAIERTDRATRGRSRALPLTRSERLRAGPDFFLECGPALEPAARQAVAHALRRLPSLHGRPIRVRTLRALRAFRGQLRSGGSAGREVHAGSFIRKREIVLDAALLGRRGELVRILIHELFHFAWVRAGNGQRRSWERLLAREYRTGRRGELGWSAELQKSELRPSDLRRRTRRWRGYACESFCDTAAWMYAGLVRHGEFTLARSARPARRAWFERACGSQISI